MEGSHKDRVQFLAPRTTTQILCMSALSKHSLNSSSFGLLDCPGDLFHAQFPVTEEPIPNTHPDSPLNTTPCPFLSF